MDQQHCGSWTDLPKTRESNNDARARSKNMQGGDPREDPSCGDEEDGDFKGRAR